LAHKKHILAMLIRYVFLVLSVFFFENTAFAQSKNTLHLSLRGSQPAIFGASLGYFRQVGPQLSVGTRLSSSSDFGRADAAQFIRSQQADVLLRFAPNAHRRAFWSIEAGPSLFRWEDQYNIGYLVCDCDFDPAIMTNTDYWLRSRSQFLFGSAMYNSLNIRMGRHFGISLDLMTNLYLHSENADYYAKGPFVSASNLKRWTGLQPLVGYQVGGVWNW
jgi:hypothetical protein